MSDSPTPYEAPSTPPPEDQSFQYVSRSRDLFEIAKAQRFVCFVILLAIALTVCSVILQRTSAVAAIVILPMQIVASIAQLVGMYRLGRTVYGSVASGIAMAILAIIPCIGLLALLIVNDRATKRLKAAGYRVGLMGADLSQFQ